MSRYCPLCGHSLSSRQTYCSGACKQKAYRRSKEHAILTPPHPRYVFSQGDDGKSAGESVCGEGATTPSTITTVTNRNAGVSQTSRERLLWAALRDSLITHAAKGGTAQGALQVAQAVFLAHGLDAAGPLPRLTRSALQELGIGKSHPLWYRGKIRTPEELERLKAIDHAASVERLKRLSGTA